MGAASAVTRQELRAKKLVNPCSHLFQFGLCRAHQYVADGKDVRLRIPTWNILSNPRADIPYPDHTTLDTV